MEDAWTQNFKCNGKNSKDALDEDKIKSNGFSAQWNYSIDSFQGFTRNNDNMLEHLQAFCMSSLNFQVVLKLNVTDDHDLL